MTNLMAAISFLKNIDSKALLEGVVKLKEVKRVKRKGRWAKKMAERERKKKEAAEKKLREERDNMEPIELEDSGDESENVPAQEDTLEGKEKEAQVGEPTTADSSMLNPVDIDPVEEEGQVSALSQDKLDVESGILKE